MRRLVRIGEAAEVLGVSISMLRRWEASGRRVADRVGTHRRYDLAKLRPEQFGVSQSATRRTVAYARVSSHDRKADLERQKQVLELHCARQGWTCEVIADLGSGMNIDKRGLKRLLDGIVAGEVGRLVVTHEDWLLRFGAKLVFAICAARQVEVVIVNRGEDTAFEDDLAEDVLEIVAVFSARLSGSRSRKNQSRQTVRRILAGTREDVFRSRSTSLDRWGDKLCTEWDGSCRNGAELWRPLRDAGFGGSQRVVSEWAARRRRAADASAGRPASVTPVPPARTIARLLTSERDCRSAEALRVRVAVETTSPKIVAARNLHDCFKTMVAAKKTNDLVSWLRDAQGSELASFTSGIMDDEDAVRAAIVELWSNGQTEGQVTKLKLDRRQMYGRGKIDLLQARMLQPG